MIWKTFWDTPHGAGTLPSFAPMTMLSNLDRLSYIEGAPTISTALVAAFVLPDFPSTSHRWLSQIGVRLAGSKYMHPFPRNFYHCRQTPRRSLSPSHSELLCHPWRPPRDFR